MSSVNGGCNRMRDEECSSRYDSNANQLMFIVSSAGIVLPIPLMGGGVHSVETDFAFFVLFFFTSHILLAAARSSNTS
jgi:hypothetical protein